jgi:photosystem II stability/assembly factor-like uncharacterized protein
MTLFTSSDGGLTVSKKSIPVGIPGPTITTDQHNDSILYIYGSGGIAKSTDGGSTWNVLSTAPQNINVFKVDLQNSAVLYVGTSSGFFKSSDSGATWSGSNTGIAAGFNSITDIALDPTNSAQVIYRRK